MTRPISNLCCYPIMSVLEASLKQLSLLQFLIFAPLSLLVTLIFIWREPKTFWLVVLQLVQIGIQVLYSPSAKRVPYSKVSW